MEVLQNSDVTKTGIPSVVTVGTFDGVHLGHMKIIDKVIADAESEGYQSVLVTFNPHPQQVVRRNNNDVLLLTSIGEKLQILKNTGLDTIVIIPFTQEFSQTEYKDFLTSYLIEKLNMKKFVLGYDAALGHERKGHLEQIKEHALQNNYSLDIVSPFKVEETVINSTLIRKKLQLAECENVKKYLGRAYNIQGKVVKGDNRGAGLGFPTANIIPDCKDKLFPKDGVYAVKVNTDGRKLNGMVNIGFRPTFHELNEADRTLEVYIFEFDSNLYGKTINLEFVQFIRNEQKFQNKNELIEQLKKDEKKCKEILHKEEK